MLLREEGGEEPPGHGPPSAVLPAHRDWRPKLTSVLLCPVGRYVNARLNLRIMRAWRWSFAGGGLSRARLRLL
jgi:hypothetical protein